MIITPKNPFDLPGLDLRYATRRKPLTAAEKRARLARLRREREEEREYRREKREHKAEVRAERVKRLQNLAGNVAGAQRVAKHYAGRSAYHAGRLYGRLRRKK